MGITAATKAAKYKLTKEQKARIAAAQRHQAQVDLGLASRKTRDLILEDLAAEGVPAANIYMAPAVKRGAQLSDSVVCQAARRASGRR